MLPAIIINLIFIYKQLQKLHNAGYKTMSLLKNNTKYQNLNSLDYYMIDLLMMMESRWLFQWGNSGVHHFVNHMLGRIKIPEKVTFKDNLLISDSI